MPKLIDTPEFKSWFGASKVVDRSGKPLVVYHGTSSKDDFDTFRRSSFKRNMQLGFGIHFSTTPEFAKLYATGKSGRTIGAYLRIVNLLDAMQIVKEGSKEYDLAEKLEKHSRFISSMKDQDGLHVLYMQNAIDHTSPQRAEKLIREAGYDGVKYKATMRGSTHPMYGTVDVSGHAVSYVVFEPGQVRLATKDNVSFKEWLADSVFAAL